MYRRRQRAGVAATAAAAAEAELLTSMAASQRRCGAQSMRWAPMRGWTRRCRSQKS